MNLSQLPFLLAFHRGMRLTHVRFKRLKEYFEGDFEKAFSAPEKELKKSGLDSRGIQKWLDNRTEVSPQKEWDLVKSHGAEVLVLGGDSYPLSLGQIYDPPALLLIRGSFEASDFPNLAVVGSRRITSYGKRAMEYLLPPIIKQGVTVVSGLAYGTDFLAHKTAVEHGGRTIAVLGSGIDEIYPTKHNPWSEYQLEAGKLVLVSENLPGTKLIPQNFPIRNRIISGLSKALVVIEGTTKSGSLITASLANDQGKEVFTVPGDIFSPQSQGPNSLIREGVAHPLTEGSQLLEALGFDAQKARAKAQKEIPRVGIESDILACFEAQNRLHIDEIKRLSGLPPDRLSSTLILLEMKGILKNMGQQHYAKNL